MAALYFDFEPSPENWAEWQVEEALHVVGQFCAVRQALQDPGLPHERKDALLGALIRVAQRGGACSSAATAVVSCLLPGLARVVWRYRDIAGEDDAWNELVCAVMRLVGTYDLERRPRRIAANLIWDATAQLLRAVRRERAWRDHVELAVAVEATATASGADPDVLVLAVEAGVLSTEDAVLVRATRLDGVRLCDAARLCGLSYEAAKKRRRRAEVAWARWWDPDRAARCPRALAAGAPRTR
jgi:hypothetical protein